jgi:hypothetical protein
MSNKNTVTNKPSTVDADDEDVIKLDDEYKIKIETLITAEKAYIKANKEFVELCSEVNSMVTPTKPKSSRTNEFPDAPRKKRYIDSDLRF